MTSKSSNRMEDDGRQTATRRIALGKQHQPVANQAATAPPAPLLGHWCGSYPFSAATPDAAPVAHHVTLPRPVLWKLISFSTDVPAVVIAVGCSWMFLVSWMLLHFDNNPIWNKGVSLLKRLISSVSETAAWCIHLQTQVQG